MVHHGIPFVSLVMFAFGACQTDAPTSPSDAGVGSEQRVQDARAVDQRRDQAVLSDLACLGSIPAVVPDGGFELLRPTGPYGVGTEVRALVDSARDEPATLKDLSDKRRIVVQLFYPVDPCPAGPPATLMTRAEAKSICDPYIGDASVFDCNSPWEALVVMHARTNMPLATTGGRFPVVLFSHGLASLRDLYVSYLEELASWGFVVVAISHTYDSAVVVFPDGSEAIRHVFWATNPTSPTVPECWAHIPVWVADARFVADQLAAWNGGDPGGRLTGRLDLDQLGMFGHSYGGSTAAETCFADSRFKAGVAFDSGFRYPAFAVSQPFMLQLRAGVTDMTKKDFFDKLVTGYQVKISGACHESFSDLPLMSNHFAGASYAATQYGSGDYQRILTASRAYTLAFFRKHLRGEAQPLLDGPSAAFPEVTFVKKP